MSRTLFCSSAVFALLLAVPAAAEPVELRWQFKQGQALKYQLRHREVRTVAIGDQKLETTTTTEYEWTWTVQEVDDQGQATLAHKFTALRVESTGKDFDFRYDSAQGNASQDDYQKKLIHLYDQLRFGEYRVQLRPDGRVASVTGFDKLLGEINADSQILDFHALNLHDDTFTWYLQQALGLLPAKAVGVGDTWEAAQDNKIGAFGQLLGKSNYLLEKPKEPTDRPGVVVKFTGNQALEMDTKWLNTPLRGTLKVTKLAGTIRFDPKVHVVQGSSVQAEMTSELLFGNETSPAKMTLGFQHTLELEAK